MEDNKQHDITGSRGDVAPDKDKVNETGEKGVEIVINGNLKVVTEDKLTFEQVVELAFPGKPLDNDMITFTVTYQRHRGPGEEPKSMVHGEEVAITKGMNFNVTLTDKS